MSTSFAAVFAVDLGGLMLLHVSPAALAKAKALGMVTAALTAGSVGGVAVLSQVQPPAPAHRLDSGSGHRPGATAHPDPSPSASDETPDSVAVSPTATAAPTPVASRTAAGPDAPGRASASVPSPGASTPTARPVPVPSAVTPTAHGDCRADGADGADGAHASAHAAASATAHSDCGRNAAPHATGHRGDAGRSDPTSGTDAPAQGGTVGHGGHGDRGH